MTQLSLKTKRALVATSLLAAIAALLFSIGYVWIGGDSPSSAAGENISQIQRVLIISIDGLRPDLLLRARTPRIRSMMQNGAYSMWARTTEMSITLPSHTSMLTGVTPEYHRIFWNHYIENVYPPVPTIFEQAHKVGGLDNRLTTGIVAGKIKFHELEKPGTVDYVDVYNDKEGNNLEVGQSAADMIRHHSPKVMFVHLPDVDVTGHAKGWGTPDQIQAIERADEAVGLMLDALVQKGLDKNTLIIHSADHGGQGPTHGPNDPRSRHIPWIAVGPGIRKNYDLTRFGDLTINTEDTFATACTLMHIPLPEYLDGKFINQIVEPQGELLKDSDDSKNKSTLNAVDRWWEPPSYKWEPLATPSHHN
jgi:arylsulfatase A-like enzyme